MHKSDKIYISSDELIDIINKSNEKQAYAEGTVFPSLNFPKVAHKDIDKKVNKIFGSKSKSKTHLFSKEQACVLSASYGELSRYALLVFFERKKADREKSLLGQKTPWHTMQWQ